MFGVFQQLMLSASIYIVCAFLIGFIYDRIGESKWRQVTCGLLIAAIVVAIRLSPVDLGDLVVDMDHPLLLIATLFGGPITAATILPAPVLVTIFSESPTLVADVASTVTPVLIGLTVLAVWHAMGWKIDHFAVLTAALASPLALLPQAVPFVLSEISTLETQALWTALGVLFFGLAVGNELRRAKHSRVRRRQRLFDSLTGTVPSSVFQQQLEHQWRLHERYGHEYAYLLVSIDEAIELRLSMGSKEWEHLRAVVATSITQATRESDVCTAVDFDRFALLLPHATLPSALPVAQRVQRTVQDKARSTYPSYEISVSIGCAEVSGTMAPNDAAAAAEGQLFFANSKGAKCVISPAPETYSDGIVRSFPGAESEGEDRRGDEKPLDAQLVSRRNAAA